MNRQKREGNLYKKMSHYLKDQNDTREASWEKFQCKDHNFLKAAN